MIDKIASFISAVMSPLWVPTYAMMVILNTSYLIVVPAGLRWALIGVVLFITGLLPLAAIAVLKRMGMVSNFDLTDRRERWLPYVLSEVCYLACALFLARVDMPDIVVDMMLGGALSVLIQLIVTRWWKISAHGAGCGALVAMVLREGMSMITFTNMLPFIVGAIIISGITGTCRLILERHTPAQVFAGWANGFLCVWLLTL